MPKTVEVIDIGDSVLCDLCNADFTHSDETGGFLFTSKAVCPGCAPVFEASIKRYHEEEYIRDRALPGESFRAFCLRLRDGDNTITITSWSK